MRSPVTFGKPGDGADGPACGAALRAASTEVKWSLLRGLMAGEWFFQKRPRVAHMFNHGWWRFALAADGDYRVEVGGWWFVENSGSWKQLAAGDRGLVAVCSG